MIGHVGDEPSLSTQSTAVALIMNR